MKTLWRRLLLSSLLCFSSFGLFAQNTTTLTGTVTDPSSQAWLNGSWTANLVNPAGGTAVYISGGNVPLSFTGQLNSSGAFPATTPVVGNNAQILPAGTSWRFTVCPVASSPCQVLPSVAITGSTYNAGTYISGKITALEIQGSIGGTTPVTSNWAYSTSEIVNQINGSGVTLTSATNSCYVWNTSTWVQYCSGGGGGGNCPEASTTAYFQYSNGTDCVGAIISYNLLSDNTLRETSNATNGSIVDTFGLGYGGDTGFWEVTSNDGYYTSILGATSGSNGIQIGNGTRDQDILQFAVNDSSGQSFVEVAGGETGFASSTAEYNFGSLANGSQVTLNGTLLGTDQNTTLYFPAGSGTIARTSDLPSPYTGTSPIVVTGSVISCPGCSSGGGGSTETHTANISAELDFTTCLLTPANQYKIVISNLLPTTNNVSLEWQASTNGGSSYDTSSSYEWASTFFRSGLANGYNGSTSDTSIALHGLTTPDVSSNNNYGGLTATFFLSNPNAGGYTFIYGQSTYIDNSLTQTATANLTGSYNSSTTVNAFRVLFSSGNIAQGTVACYAIPY